MNERDNKENESWLSAAVKPMDGVIAIAAICILSVMDFSKMPHLTFKKACLTFFIYITGAWTDAQDLISNIKTGCLCLIYCCLKFFFHISQIYFSVRAELI